MVAGWTDSVNQNPAVGAIRDLGNRLTAAMKTTASPGAIEQVKRAQAVVKHLQDGLHRPELVSLLGLNGAKSHLDGALVETEAFINDGDENHLSAMNEQLDNALFQMRMPNPPRRESQGLLEEARRYEEAVRKLHQESEGRLTDLTGQISQALTDFQRRLSELTSASDTAQQSIQSDATSRIEQLQVEADSLKQRLDSVIEQQQQTFLQAESSRTKDFADSLTKLSTDFQDKLSALTAETGAKLQDIEARGEKAISGLEGYHEEARNIVAIRAASGVVGSYINVAKEQLKQANFWRWVALLLLVAVFVSVIGTARSSPLGNDNRSAGDFLEYGLTRVPIVLALAGLWGYAARESSKHRRREASAERLATELTSFRPFLAELTVEERRKLVEKATERYFKGYDLQDSSPGEDS